MEKPPVKLSVWNKVDPLEPFTRDLLEKVNQVSAFRAEWDGGAFTIFTDGVESGHIADMALYRTVEQQGNPILKRIAAAIRWAFQCKPGPPIVQIRRSPDPGGHAEEYFLFIRINDCPEIEDVVLSVCKEWKDRFKGGISVYSERSGDVEGIAPEGSEAAESQFDLMTKVSGLKTKVSGLIDELRRSGK